MSKLSIDFIESISTLVGIVIGAGIFAIPYVMAKAGFITGVINLLVLGSVTLLLYLYLGEIVLRTKGKCQLTGYAERYIGKKGEALMAFSLVFSTYGAMIAYLIGIGGSLEALFNL